ncbi:unnamed protein product [Clonostachys rosea]|uniref:AttH domain-containing protein n=1 Tax=Bionectria ochroleuca TaxID=29856 RepID=A0ABY6V1L7_BIOOC|nr:unnamed protein product [Clonostachys rosea]
MLTTITSDFNIHSSIARDTAVQSDFIPENGNIFPKFSDSISKTAVDLWLFDAIAEDGSSAITISFFRDALAAPAGYRIAVNAIWADGEIWGTPLVFPQSVITSEGPDPNKGTVVGTWRTDKDNSYASFEVSADLSTATVAFNVPRKVVGTLKLKSLGFPSLPSTARDAEASSGVYWMRPIAAADATVHMEFFFQTPEGDVSSKPLEIGGNTRAFGGMDRSWESLGWAGAFSDSVFLRAKVGPYDLQNMLLVGKSNKNYPLSASASLYCDGKLVCAPRSVRYAGDDGANREDGDAMIITRLLEGEGLPAVFRHQNVGYRLEFRSKGQTWVFETRHHRAWYCKPMKPPAPSGTGSSGFLVSVSSTSPNSAEPIKGIGYEGQVVLPE